MHVYSIPSQGLFLSFVFFSLLFFFPFFFLPRYSKYSETQRFVFVLFTDVFFCFFFLSNIFGWGNTIPNSKLDDESSHFFTLFSSSPPPLSSSSSSSKHRKVLFILKYVGAYVIPIPCTTSKASPCIRNRCR